MSEYEKIIERYRKHSKEAHGDDGSVRISGFPKFSEFGIKIAVVSRAGSGFTGSE
ncbi:hypothetical protein C427_2492 [Paraglaciecola psychrophila 170]|uniref:Uncharacterized protein n=1 Tax=Paraglaciecola psychrophila 170 TaxID=1129794 RepID=M4RM16_9ALTE|nr:hypothetical protein [Paraglaciecola psychrophila]AGH44601.1 hypothetical protein C427_2492 [Paraglaciecola psychrophila 170]